METGFVDMVFPLICTTDKGSKIKYEHRVNDVEVEIYCWIEECHGYHEVCDVVDRSYEEEWDKIAEDLDFTNDEVTQMLYESELIDDDERVISWDILN